MYVKYVGCSISCIQSAKLLSSTDSCLDLSRSTLCIFHTKQDNFTNYGMIQYFIFIDKKLCFFVKYVPINFRVVV